MPTINLNSINKFFKPEITPLAKWWVKLILLILSAIFIFLSFFYTNSIAKEILNREKALIDLYIDIYEYYSDPVSNFEDIAFFQEKIIPQINFPIIITDSSDAPLEPFETFSLNVKTDSNLSYTQTRMEYQKLITKMKDVYDPIVLVDTSGKILQKYYFYHSSIVDKLKMMPFIAFAIFLLFSISGYIALNASRRNEESKIWIGMAKEAAHQLGTPLSSLLAWAEILRMRSDDPDFNEIIDEIQKDLERLNVVTTRFSKIGSKPDLTMQNIGALIEQVSTYFEKRLPNLGRKISIVREIDKEYYCYLNADLFSWVFENLFKNAAEAIEEKNGSIFITIKEKGDWIRIYVRDTGKGMTPKIKRNVFSPGFTTKKRGWGLGLSLTKKIVEDYHNGKIVVKDTAIGKGTTFVIDLPKTI
jgi:hypothetical protein